MQDVSKILTRKADLKFFQDTVGFMRHSWQAVSYTHLPAGVGLQVDLHPAACGHGSIAQGLGCRLYTSRCV